MRLLPLLLVPCLVCGSGPCARSAVDQEKSLPRPNTRTASGGTKDNAEPVVIFDGLCKALQENYPMLEYAGWRDDAWTAEFRPRILAASSRPEAFGIMEELVCRLNDYHTRLSWPEKPSLASPPFRVEPVLAAESAPTDHSIWGQCTRPSKCRRWLESQLRSCP